MSQHADYLEEDISEEEPTPFRKGPAPRKEKASMSPRRYLVLVINGVYGQLLWARINNNPDLEVEKEHRINELLRQAADMGVSLRRNPKTGRYVLADPKEEAGKFGDLNTSPIDMLHTYFDTALGTLFSAYAELQDQYQDIRDAENRSVMNGNSPTDSVQTHYLKLVSAKHDIKLYQAIRNDLLRLFGVEVPEGIS